MKRLDILVGTFIVVFCASTIAQENTLELSSKQEVQQMLDTWNQAMLQGDVSMIKDYFPANGKTFFVSYQNIQEMKTNELITALEGQFQRVKYPKYELLADPLIYITEDGNTAFVYSTMEVVYEMINTKKGEEFKIVGLEVLTKENGKWVSLLKTTEEAKEKRKLVEVDKSILDEYNGTYRSERTGNVFTIENDGKNLISTLENETSTYLPQSEYSFYKDQFAQSIVFGRDTSGKVQFYTYIKGNTCTVMTRIDPQ